MEAVKRTFDVNVIGPIRIIKAFLPGMLNQNSGRFVTVASVCSYFGFAYAADYCASKFAIFGFMESLRHELQLAKSNVKTTLIHPYFVKTAMFDGVCSFYCFFIFVV